LLRKGNSSLLYIFVITNDSITWQKYGIIEKVLPRCDNRY